MRTRFQNGFTLIEVMVATGILVLFATGALMTAWRLVGFARDYVDETAADAYCHNVIYAADASSNRLDHTTPMEWSLTEAELPKIVSRNLLGGTRTVHPLWRSGESSKYPTCTLAYSTDDVSNLVVTVRWWDSFGNERSRSAYATVIKEP